MALSAIAVLVAAVHDDHQATKVMAKPTPIAKAKTYPATRSQSGSVRPYPCTHVQSAKLRGV